MYKHGATCDRTDDLENHPAAEQMVKIGLIGGSGLGQALAQENGESIDVETPFGTPSSPLLKTSWNDVDLVILQRHGPGHTLQPSQVPYRANVFALKKLGVTHIVATGATGSLREDIRPRDLVLTDQVLDRTRSRQHTFYERAAVHVEFADPCCPVLRAWLIAAGKRLDKVRIHESGTYVCMEGPAFSTRAESRLHRSWGGDVIGMTILPEAKLAREAEIAYAHVALATDYDCWRPHDPGTTPQALLQEIIGHLQAASENSLELLRAALSDTAALAQACPAHEALSLAIWTDKASIPRQERSRLDVLWGRHFE